LGPPASWHLSGKALAALGLVTGYLLLPFFEPEKKK
jgi:hypothetical protein